MSEANKRNPNSPGHPQVSSSGHALLESPRNNAGIPFISSGPTCTTRTTAAGERWGPAATDPAAQAAIDQMP